MTASPTTAWSAATGRLVGPAPGLFRCTATTTTRNGAGRCTGGCALFERMSLEAFQSGLSWLIILRKRENFRHAFDGFDIEKVARYTDADMTRLMADTGNRSQPRQDRGDDRQRARRRRRSMSTSASCCGRSRRRRGPGPPASG